MRDILQKLESLSGHDVHGQAVLARGNLAGAEAQMAACLLVIDRTRYYQQLGYGSLVHYAEAHLNLDASKAVELLRAARQLEHLPLLSAAFSKARLGWGKIRELTRVVTPSTEEEWVNFALTRTTDEVRRAVALNPRDYKLRAQQENGQELPLDAAPGPSLKAEVPEPVECASALPARASRPPGPSLPQASSSIPSSTDSLLDGLTGDRAASQGGSELKRAPEGPGHPRNTHSWDGSPVGPGYASVDTGGHPLPVPGPQLVRLSLLLTPQQFAEFERAQKLLSSRKGRRVSREEAVAQMAHLLLAGAPARSQVRQQVLIHVDAATETAWLETERGLFVLNDAQRDQALQESQIQFDFTDRAQADSRTQSEQTNRGKSSARTEGEQTNRGKSSERTEGEQTNRGKSGLAGRSGLNQGRKLDPRPPIHVLAALFARAGGRCETPGCGSTYCLQVHHEQPRCEGGSHDLHQLTLRCAGCHTVKHVKDYEDKPHWRRGRSRRRKAPG